MTNKVKTSKFTKKRTCGIEFFAARSAAVQSPGMPGSHQECQGMLLRCEFVDQGDVVVPVFLAEVPALYRSSRNSNK